MTISVTHATVATLPDEAGAEINKDEWNAAHTVTGAVPDTRTVNGHALTSNVTVTASDVGAPSGSGTSSGTNTGDQDLSGLLVKASNLSDLTNAGTARTNLGLGTLATQSGTFSGTSSGTNTGDQTITLTGNVTGSGTGSFATTIANGVVTEAMQVLADNTTQNVSTSKHGYAPKAPNDATKYLDGTGAYSTPSGGSGVPSGTSFPGSPSTNDLYYRTDRSLLYFYNGTRWLTLQQYLITFQPTKGAYENLGATSNGFLRGIPAFGATYDFWMEELRWSNLVGGTSNSSNYWVFELGKHDAADSRTVVANPDTKTETASTWYNVVTSIGALLGTSSMYLQINMTKTSSPGNLFIGGAVLVGRLVG